MNNQASFALAVGFLVLAVAGCSELPSTSANASQEACLQSGGSLSKKLRACDAAIRSHHYTGSHLADLYFMKGIHQQDAGRHTAAIHSFIQALKQNPNASKVYYYLSMSQLRLGHFVAAQHDFETAHRLN